VEAVTLPKDWQLAHFANVGTDETFMREMLEIEQILQGTLIEGPQREEAKSAIMTILLDGLIPAFMELRTIRAPETVKLPLAERFQPYEDFARKLWKAYKDLTQRAAEAMGFDIGFLYHKESTFEQGLKDFRKTWPALQPGVEDFFREQRSGWQTEFSMFRNGFVEHQEGQRMDFKKFYDNAVVEHLFQSAWGAIIDILVILMSQKLPPRVHIVVNDPKVHGPWPNRYRWVIEGVG
jgi:hypothetical protein